MNTYQSHYLRVRKKAFNEFSGWEEDETVRWANPLIKLMERAGGVVINETPMFYVARELASHQEYYDKLAQRGRQDLIVALERVLNGGGSGQDFPPAYDFSTAKAEIQKVLEASKG